MHLPSSVFRFLHQGEKTSIRVYLKWRTFIKCGIVFLFAIGAWFAIFKEIPWGVPPLFFLSASSFCLALTEKIRVGLRVLFFLLFILVNIALAVFFLRFSFGSFL